jgi:hypothetical protein
MKRNPDGTWRNARHAEVLSDRTIRARWIRAEILWCKRTGISMAEIAVHVGRVGQGYEKAFSPLPDGIVFPPDYKISESAVFKAYHAALDRQPAANAEVLRKEDTGRLEDMYFRLQRGIGSGDPRSIDAGVRVLAHKAKLNGYAVEPDQNPGLSAFSITIVAGDQREDEKEAVAADVVRSVPKKLPKP